MKRYHWLLGCWAVAACDGRPSSELRAEPTGPAPAPAATPAASKLDACAALRTPPRAAGPTPAGGVSRFQVTAAVHGNNVLMTGYDWRGKYLDAERGQLDAEPKVVKDASCVVQYRFDWGLDCYPPTIVGYGLEAYSKSLKGSAPLAAPRAEFLRVADWLVANQDARGGWSAEHEYDCWPERVSTLPAGWYSAATQGLAISVLVRAFHVQSNARYLEAARAAVGVLRTPVGSGGVMQSLAGQVFYEGLPTVPMSNVLTDHLSAVIGLYDLWRASGDAVYGCYFREAVASVKIVISRYDLGNFTAHDLLHLQQPGASPNPATWAQHEVHVTQLSWLGLVTADAFFAPVVQRWAGYTDDKPVEEN